MLAPAIYRSTDTNAPVLFGGGGSLITLLDAILVNGYGSAFSSGTITIDASQPADGDTVTIGTITYTFRTSLTAQPAYAVAIGGSASAAFINFQAAINQNGIASAHYSIGTLANPDAYVASATATVLTLVSRKGGSASNSIALARTAVGTPHYSVSGATLTGGGGSDTKASAGWTKAYGTFPQAAYRQPAGCRFYLQVDDSGPGGGGAREARCTGWEAMTAYNTGLGQFPTPAQVVAGAVCRKSNQQDSNARAWIAFVDDRTVYLFTSSNDTAGNYHGFSFGDFYSFNVADAYKCLIMGGTLETSSPQNSSSFGQTNVATAGTWTGHYLPRNYTGIGGSTNFAKVGDYSLAQGDMRGVVGFPNASDGGLYVSALRMIDGSIPGVGLAGTFNLRGRIRGMYHICHPLAAFADGDTFVGVGEYAGRNFMVVKYVLASAANTAFAAIETTPWEVSV
jgi:hypothetical protein